MAVPGAAAAAAVAAAQERLGPTVKIPLFLGDSKDMKPAQWCATVDRAKQVSDWSDEQAAAAALDHLRGIACTWKENLEMGSEAERANLLAWPALRAAFLTRWTEEASAQQKVGLFLALQQKENETAETFFDRTDYALKKCTKEEYTAMANADAREGFIAGRQAITKLMFLKGLLPGVRVWVEGVLQEADPTLTAVRKAATKADTAIRSKKSPANLPINAILEVPGAAGGAGSAPATSRDEEIARLQQQINAMQAGGGGSRGGGGGRGGGRGRGGRGGAGTQVARESQNVKAVPMRERDWILCYKCNQYGQHFAHECTLTSDDIKKLTKQTPADRPSGRPSDRQFPN